MKNKLIRYLLLSLRLSYFGPLLAQPADKNYVERLEILKPYYWEGEPDLNDDNQMCHRKSYLFYDDLGRATVSASGGLNGKGTYIYSLVDYDNMGRKCKAWIPFEGGNEATFTFEQNLRTMSAQALGDAHGYHFYQYDALGNPTGEMGPGMQWYANDKRTHIRYVTNKAQSVRRFDAPVKIISLVDSGYYEAGTLTGEAYEDEDGMTRETYMDLSGNIVLERRNGDNDTYYVYNAYGQLRYVLSPQYQKSGFKAMYAYEYRYDSHGNMVKKLLPGCDYIQYWYNENRQVVFVQDATLRERKLFRFMLYDPFGRMVIQGLCATPNKSGRTNKCEYTGGIDSFCSTGYTLAEPAQLPDATLETVIYYDGYDFLTTYSEKYPEVIDSLRIDDSPCAKTQVTGSWQVASNGKEILSAMYYDLNGQMTDSRSVVMNSHLISVHNDYTFTGVLELSHKQDYVMENGYMRLILSSSLYNHYGDNTGLLESSELTLRLSDGTIKSQAIQSLSYDGVGRVASVSRGGNAGAVSYDYDIRGHVCNIEGKYFAEKLHYVDGPGIPCYNGNVSCQQWKTSNEGFLRGYKFSYDKLDRLVSAQYAERDDMSHHLNRYNEEGLVYNENGGIKKLQRHGRKDNGEYGKIDNLTFNLTGNRIYSVKDDADPVNSYASMDFKENTMGGQKCFYNGVGALVCDVNKGIAHIEYDNLNHPREIQFTNGGIIRYVYAADGTKLRTTYITPVENIVVPINSTLPLQPSQIISEDSVEYLGEEIYANGELEKFLFADGYVSLATPDPKFHYFTKDHLGNVRTVTDEQGTLEQVSHYYPFGGIYGDAGLNQTLQPCTFGGKELDRMHGLNWYDFGARMYDPALCTWTSFDALGEKFVSHSPFGYCGDNPINAIDEDGNDWYSIENGTILWQPNIKGPKDLPKGKGYKYIGETYTDMNSGTFYRKDGSILFFNETLAYQRMWYLADNLWRTKNFLPGGREESAILLNNGHVLVMPDNWNDSQTSKMPGYKRKRGCLYTPFGEKFSYIGQVHTHQTGNDKGLSQNSGTSSDGLFASEDPGIPIFALHKNGNVYAGYWQSDGNFQVFGNKPIGKNVNFLHGYSSFIKSAKLIIKLAK